MEQYKVTLKGLTPLIMHKDNLYFKESIKEWTKNPENKGISIAGDDRSPAWTWIGSIYHDGNYIGVDQDNIMTMLREGGAKVKTGNGKETYKKHTQSGIIVDQQQFDLYSNGKRISIEPIKKLIGNNEFSDHIKLVESLGFELFLKRARVSRTKHLRVRPMFRNWELRGSVTVIDEELSGLTKEILKIILNQSGSLIGLCDFRPSSPQSPGRFGQFSVEIG